MITGVLVKRWWVISSLLILWEPMTKTIYLKILWKSYAKSMSITHTLIQISSKKWLQHVKGSAGKFNYRVYRICHIISKTTIHMPFLITNRFWKEFLKKKHIENKEVGTKNTVKYIFCMYSTCAFTVAENPQNRWKNCRDFYHGFFISKCHKG